MSRARADITLGDVTQHNLKQMKKLNSIIFPVTYNEKFYAQVLESGELVKLAYYNDIPVGVVYCRIEASDNCRRLYIMTLGCLFHYRRLGVGSALMKHLIDYIEKDGNIDSIYLHVQINNEDAIGFYKHFGFEIVNTIKDYYKRTEPSDAYVFEKTLRVVPITIKACEKNEFED